MQRDATTPANDQGPEPVSALLREWAAGDRAAGDRVFALAYRELHAVARRQRRAWHGDHTLDTTALLHEAYLKVAGGGGLDANGRAHFMAIAARAMRQVLANYARARRAARRGGDDSPVTLDGDVGAALVDSRALAPDEAFTLAALEDALARLEQVSERQCRVVECRFLAQLSVPETAEALGISPATVKRDWAVAQAWLHRELLAHGAEP